MKEIIKFTIDQMNSKGWCTIAKSDLSEVLELLLLPEHNIKIEVEHWSVDRYIIRKTH